MVAQLSGFETETSQFLMFLVTQFELFITSQIEMFRLQTSQLSYL